MIGFSSNLHNCRQAGNDLLRSQVVAVAARAVEHRLDVGQELDPGGGQVGHPRDLLGGLSSSLAFANAIGDREHELPVRRQPIEESLRHGRLCRAKDGTIIGRPTRKLTAQPSEAAIVDVTEMGNALRPGAPLLRDEDGSGQDRVGGLLAFAGDRLRAEGRELSRLIGIGVAAHDTLSARPTGIDDLTQFWIIDEGFVGLVDDERSQHPAMVLRVFSKG